MHRLAAIAVGIVATCALVISSGEAAGPSRDYAAASWSILAPGETGSLTFDRNTRDQARLYDGLTPLAGDVAAQDLRRYFKPAPLGLGSDRGRKREQPRSGVSIVRDTFGVAHVTGKTEADVAYGAGWVTAADRGELLQRIRGPARLAALDVPGLDPLELAFSGKSFVPSPEAEAYLANQLDAVRSQGELGRRVLAIVKAYAAGINGYYRANGIPMAPFTAIDVVACTALISARFGTNGGQEARNAMFLDALESRLGETDARAVFADLRESNDPETPVSVAGSFPQQLPAATAPGSVVIDDGSFTGRAPAACRLGVERAPRRCEALRDGPPALRRRAAGGLLVPRATGGDGALRSRLRRARRDVPRRALRARRTRPGLRVERVVVTGRQRRPVRGDAVRRRLPLPLPWPVRAHAAILAGDAEGPGSAGRAALLLRDGARAGRRVRDDERCTGRDLVPALDARPRAPQHSGVLRARHGPRDLRIVVSEDDELCRVQLQLVLRGRSRHRDVLEWTSAHSCARDGSGSADCGDRRLRLARVRLLRRTSEGDQPAVGRDPELEQQACRERRRR